MKRLPPLLLVGVLLGGCRFNPALDYPPCEQPSDCPAPCVCGSGHCLPPAGSGAGPEACIAAPQGCESNTDCMAFCECKDKVCLPREADAFSPAECDPQRIAPGDPLGMLGFLGTDWGSWPERNLVVNSIGDEAAPPAGEITLRSALAKAAELSKNSDLPVRITFDPMTFPPYTDTFIHVEAPLNMTGRNVFLDGRGSRVVLKPANPQDDTPFRVSCRTCLVANLQMFMLAGFGMEVLGAEDLYLMGLEISNCGEGAGHSAGGLLIAGGSRRITIGDGQGHPEIGEPLGCYFHNNTGPGLVIGDMDSPPEDITVFGVTSAENTDYQTMGVGAGIAVRGRAKNVSIGVPPGLDRRVRAINEFRDNGQFGVSLSGEIDRVIVRGNLFVGQPFSVHLKNLEGEVKFIHNTLIEPQQAMVSCSAIPAKGQALFWARNNIFYSASATRNFWDMQATNDCGGLEVSIDYAFLYNISCVSPPAASFCQWWDSATKFDEDPEFQNLDWPIPGSANAANGADPNLVLDDKPFDTNGPAPGLHNGVGPAFGALEEP